MSKFKDIAVMVVLTVSIVGAIALILLVWVLPSASLMVTNLINIILFGLYSIFAVISGYFFAKSSRSEADMLAMRPNLTDEQKFWLQIVSHRSHDLPELIQSVLDLSKIEAGNIVIDRTRFEIRQMIQDLIISIIPAAEKKKLRIEWGVAPDVPDKIIADVSRLRQVLSNLLSNAVKFTEQGLIELRVQNWRNTWLARAPASDEMPLLFSFKDTGLGIPAERKDNIFDTFEYAGNEHAIRHGGIGLGLSIARRLVDLMGGRIWVESEKGRGSTFYFTILAGIPPEEVSEQGDSRIFPDSGKKRKLRILIVDDDMTSRVLVEILMRRAGQFVLTANDGWKALECMEVETFDVVLMNIGMPGMDGLEVTRRIREREHKSGRHTIIIALTAAYAMAGDRERCLAAGMDEHLVKPIKEADLQAVIRQTTGCQTGRRCAMPGSDRDVKNE